MLILLPVCRNLLSAIRGSFQVRNSVTVGSYMHVYLYGKRILILLICMLSRSCGGILLSKCLESLDHSKYGSVLQWPAGAFFLQNIIFLVQTLWKDQCGSVLPHVTVLLVFFKNFSTLNWEHICLTGILHDSSSCFPNWPKIFFISINFFSPNLKAI